MSPLGPIGLSEKISKPSSSRNCASVWFSLVTQVLLATAKNSPSLCCNEATLKAIKPHWRSTLSN